MDNKISIIVPVYNSGERIKSLYKGIKEQNYKNYEIIFVDDGSKDNSKEIIRKLINNDNRIKYIYEKNQGPGMARKKGIKEAKGKLIFFIDSDDEMFDENVLFKINSIYQKTKFDFLIFKYVTADGIYRNPIKNEKMKDGFIDKKRIKTYIEGRLMV